MPGMHDHILCYIFLIMNSIYATHVERVELTRGKKFSCREEREKQKLE